MRSSFLVNLLKMIAASAVITLLLSFAGKQTGIMVYSLFNPEKPVPVTPVVHLPVKNHSPVKPEPAPVIVKKAVVKKPKPRPDAVKESSVPTAALPAKDPAPSTGESLVRPRTILLYPDTKNASQDIYAIQTGVYSARKNVDNNIQTFIRKGYDPALVILTCDSGKKIYAVRIGAYQGKKNADKAFREFKKKDPHEAIMVPLYRKKDMMSFCK